MRVIPKWTLGCKGLRHVADVRLSPRSGTWRKNISTEKIYEFAESNL